MTSPASKTEVPAHTGDAIPLQGEGVQEPTSAKRGRKAVWIGAATAVVGVAAVAVGVYGFSGNDHAAPSYRLVPPSTYLNMVRDDSTGAAWEVLGPGSNISIGPAGSKQVLTEYAISFGDIQPVLMVAGAYGAGFVPNASLSGIWDAVRGGVQEDAITQKTDENPGPLGGVMQCAVLENANLRAPACAWVDGSTMAIVVDTTQTGLNDDLDTTAATVRQLRAVMEKP